MTYVKYAVMLLTYYEKKKYAVMLLTRKTKQICGEDYLREKKMCGETWLMLPRETNMR